MNEFEKEVKATFKKIMAEEACDLAEVLFNSEDEKSVFIANVWNDYGDDIEQHVYGAVTEAEFMNSTNAKKEELVRNAIKDNFESIFDKSFNE